MICLQSLIMCTRFAGKVEKTRGVTAGVTTQSVITREKELGDRGRPALFLDHPLEPDFRQVYYLQLPQRCTGGFPLTCHAASLVAIRMPECHHALAHRSFRK